MRNILQKYNKLFSIALTVVCSVFVVAVVVSAATTIGTSITTAGDITASTGNVVVTAGNLTVGGLSTLGKASSTFFSTYGALYVGSTATTTISGATTSTFVSSLAVAEAGGGTSTVQIGRTTDGGVGNRGNGGCIAMAADDGTVVYLMVHSVAGRYELATSTAARDCGY